MKLSKPAQIIIFSVPIVVGLYLIYKQFAISAPPANNDAPPQPEPAPEPAPSPQGGGGGGTISVVYPLQKGSINSTVKSLQTLLNTALSCQNQTLLVVDGNFGSKTQVVLQSLYGKSTIDSLSDFNNLKSQLSNACTKSANLNWGWQLLDKQKGYLSGTSTLSVFVVEKPIRIYQVTTPLFGLSSNQWSAVTPSNVLDLPALNYSLDDYQIQEVTNDGGLRIQITNGDLAGMYITESGTDLTELDIQ